MSARLDPVQLVAAGFTPVDVGGGFPPYWSHTFGDGYELAIEPLTFGRWQVALYQHGELQLPRKLEIPSR